MFLPCQNTYPTKYTYEGREVMKRGIYPLFYKNKAMLRPYPIPLLTMQQH